MELYQGILIRWLKGKSELTRGISNRTRVEMNQLQVEPDEQGGESIRSYKTCNGISDIQVD